MVPFLSILHHATLQTLDSTFFFLKDWQELSMNFSEYLKRKQKAADTYKSNWQGRDASEVTYRRVNISNKNNSTVHHGPIPTCCEGTFEIPPSQTPNSGFSTYYSLDTVIKQRAGCANCNDPVWGTAGGVALLSCAEVSTILTMPSNPVKGTNLTISPTEILIKPDCYCADPGVLPNNRGVVVAKDQVNSPTISGRYTGWRNQVPAPDNGSQRRQVIPYPSN
jgi:hypothetical protein